MTTAQTISSTTNKEHMKLALREIELRANLVELRYIIMPMLSLAEFYAGDGNDVEAAKPIALRILRSIEAAEKTALAADTDKE